MRPKICVSVSPRTTSELVNSLERAEELSADLAEVRFDKLNREFNPRHFAISGKLRMPLIATNRQSLEQRPKSEKERLNLLFNAVDAGFQYVDLELTVDDLGSVLEKFREKKVKVVLSAHDYTKTPARKELDSILAKISSFKPDICKLVTTARTPADNLAILNVLEESREAMPLVCFAMGRQGVWSRILAPFHGAPFTYACLEPGMETAPGQPSISELRQVYSILGNR